MPYLRKSAVVWWAVALLACLTACGREDSAALTSTTAAASRQTLSVEAARARLIEQYGLRDADTGFALSYVYRETVTYAAEDYLVFTWQWRVDEGQYSRITDVAVRSDGGWWGEWDSGPATP